MRGAVFELENHRSTRLLLPFGGESKEKEHELNPEKSMSDHTV